MSNENIITNLSGKEVAALKAVDELGDCTVSEIAKKSGLKRTTVYNFIDDLVDSGFLRSQEINGVRHYFSAEETFNLIESEAHGLAGKYQNMTLLTSKQAIKRQIKNTLLSKNRQVDWMVGSPESTDYLGKRFIESYIAEAIKKEIEIRTLRSPLTIPDHRFGSDEAIKNHGRNLRVANSNLLFKTTITIYDDTLTFISPDHDGVGYVIRDQAMAESFRFIFNGLWKYSKLVGEEKYE